MIKSFVLYNPLAGDGHCREKISRLNSFLTDSAVYCDMTKSETYEKDLFRIKGDDRIIICGGDGTLNRFINLTENLDIKNEIFYYPTGNGNDFARDLGIDFEDGPFPVTDYIHNLPSVEVKNRKYHFLNGIGFGIDSYCCEVCDRQKRETDEPTDYISVALHSILSGFDTVNAKVTVDGVSHSYKRVWLAPTMLGKFYGGGLMPAPNQNRCSIEKTLSIMVIHDIGRLGALLLFRSLYSGKHLTHRKSVELLTGHEIKVEFDRPTVLHIDGELIPEVESYMALMPGISNSVRNSVCPTA